MANIPNIDDGVPEALDRVMQLVCDTHDAHPESFGMRALAIETVCRLDRPRLIMAMLNNMVAEMGPEERETLLSAIVKGFSVE